MNRYEWGQGHWKVPAQVVGEVVAQIEDREGVCSPGSFVEAARPEDSPVHDLLTWDDTEAAERYRVHQARGVIRSLRVVVDTAGPSRIAFASVNTVVDDEAKRGYRATEKIRADELLHRQVLRQAIAQLNGLRRRYADLAELEHVWHGLDELSAKAS